MRLKSAAIAIVLSVLFAGGAFAQYTSTVIPAYWDTPERGVSGRQIVSGSVTLPTLVALQADADTSITTAIIDLTGQDRLPGRAFYYFTATGLVGGTGTAKVDIAAYWHALSTETAGASAGYTNNAIYLGTYLASGAAPLTQVNWGTASAVYEAFFQTASTGKSAENGPRYVSFKFDKEGAGKYTAGTMTLVWIAYAP